MFSKACEYGLRAIVFITSKSETGTRIGIKEICKEIEAPEHFTAKILQNLSRIGIINSVKGPNGGFYTDERGKDIKLIEVVKAIDGNKLFTGCGLGIKACSDKIPCPIHYEFKKIRDSLKDMLEKTSIRDVTKDLEKGLVFLKK